MKYKLKSNTITLLIFMTIFVNIKLKYIKIDRLENIEHSVTFFFYKTDYSTQLTCLAQIIYYTSDTF